MLPLFTAGRARLLDVPKLVSQFAGLERRAGPMGKEKIDHGPGGHDDLCNAAALAMVSATTVQRGPRLFFGQISKPRQSNGQRGNSYRTVHSGHAIQSQQGKLK
jgi:hypothetical protein